MKHNLKWICLIIGLFIAMEAATVILVIRYKKWETYIPVLNITGDVLKPQSIKTMEGFDTVNIVYKNKNIKVLQLKDVIKQSEPWTKNNNILIVGDDGLTAEIQDNNLEGCYIAFTQANGWECINKNYPVSSNIKRIAKIVIASNTPSWNFGINIINSDKNIASFTPGQLFMKQILLTRNFEGKASVNHNGKTFEDSIYTLHQYIKLKDLADTGSGIIAMGQDGAYGTDSGDGYLEIKGNTIDYVYPDLKKRVVNIKGILVNASQKSNMDAYYDAQHFLDNGENVMVILMDGFGYNQYEKYMESNSIPYLKSLPAADKASTEFIPVTNTGLAAVITGKSPQENGVYSRSQRELKVSTIFDYINKIGEKGVLVEGNVKILDTKGNIILNSDINSNGSFDDEIYKSALNAINEKNNFIFVHFHSIDDAGHNFGPLGADTIKAAKQVDAYIKDMVSKWHGEVIITSDHGMHVAEAAGEHGSFVYEDMIVPYLITKGGK